MDIDRLNPMRRFIPFIVVVFFAPAIHAEEPTQAEKLFSLKVDPLLRKKCHGCHGDDPDAIESGFDIRSRETVLRGGDSFGTDVLVPGKAADSALYEMVRHEIEDFEMPPKISERLTDEETWWIRDWINGGAPWPNEERVRQIYSDFAAGVTMKTSGGLSDEWTNRKYDPADLWAWQPIRKDFEIPSGTHPIDDFVNAQLAAKKIPAAPRSDRAMLLRRATFDLLGLPPRSTDLQRFAKDNRPDAVAWREEVDRLLASKHYGEQWGRHWLDVVRYADSSGFANDWERPNAWRYRDYVIRAFNADKPYNEFLREQIAGDELSEKLLAGIKKPSSKQRARADELLIAAGFLRMGPWEHTSMSVGKVTRQLFLDDITDSVGQVFLGHALQCCRCHDHKFDPIPTRDYYSIQAVFATTQFGDLDTGWLPAENRSGMQEEHQLLQQRQTENQQMLRRVNQRKFANEAQWFKDRDLPYKTRAEAKKAGLKNDQLPPARLLKSPDDFGQERLGRKWQQRYNWEFDRFKPIAFSVYNGHTQYKNSARFHKPKNPTGKGLRENTAILTGGDPHAAAEPVDPGILSAAATGGANVKLPTDISGRRSALAEWMVHPDNPLTVRVIANRVWHFHFGRGIAGNPNNFGATGKKPTHPELLDFLANYLVQSGWSIKSLHRLILTSETWCRSSEHPQPKLLADKDPSNSTYAVFQPRRLAAEEMRDTMLAVSGELNSQAGGIPIRPDINLEAALQPRMIMGTFAPSYVPNSKPDQRNRRSIYALKLRGHRDPLMETFNQPGSEKSCEIRDTSTVAPQALTLLNGQETNDRALAFAADVLNQPQSKERTDEEIIQMIFRRAYGRSGSKDEVKSAVNHWQRMTKVEASLKYEPTQFPTTVQRRASEENTGEPFTFTERLFGYETYEPDLQPHQVSPRTRGLANVCLAILNSNEFVFVY